MMLCIPSGARSGSPAASETFISLAQMASSSSGMPMKLPITRETIGWATSATRSQLSRPSRRSSTRTVISRIGVLVGGDPLRREARLEEHLEPVVLGRVHADEHRPHQLEREPVGDRGDAAHLGGVGPPVAADGVDVLGPGDRPVAGLVGVLGDARGPVDGALVAQPGEQLVRRAVEPELPLGHQHLVEIAFAVPGRGHDELMSPAPPDGPMDRRQCYWLASQLGGSFWITNVAFPSALP